MELQERQQQVQKRALPSCRTGKCRRAKVIALNGMRSDRTPLEGKVWSQPNRASGKCEVAANGLHDVSLPFLRRTRIEEGEGGGEISTDADMCTEPCADGTSIGLSVARRLRELALTSGSIALLAAPSPARFRRRRFNSMKTKTNDQFLYRPAVRNDAEYDGFLEVINLNTKEDSWLCERSILAPKNDQVNDINTKILKIIPGDTTTHTHIRGCPLSSTILNSISTSGLLSHKIKLKIGVPIILLRNSNPPKLCNGTRLKVTGSQRHIIENCCFYRMRKRRNSFHTKNSNHTHKLPFPANLCFSMTFNKAQGQTIPKVGLELSESCFSHGQLYVACSRVSDSTKLSMLTPALPQWQVSFCFSWLPMYRRWPHVVPLPLATVSRNLLCTQVHTAADSRRRLAKRRGGVNSQTARLPPSRTGFDTRRVRSWIFARGNRAGQCRWLASFLRDIPYPPPLYNPALLHTHLASPSGSQGLDVKRSRNLPTLHFTLSLTVSFEQNSVCSIRKNGHRGKLLQDT
ncbi:hypothetical protein PR048_014759 [Dryococelus australis]|uniref:DNA helicase Pif1-like 2B domain-containing protein n=1 Tax=Dryococelus australis TaxID=614101 RepID=A0ABQ9HF73_9NEOP|nr:hypothetical protein PR048_014759 [Dryococelus australis]